MKKLVLPMPPSVDKMLIPSWNSRRMIYTKEYRAYQQNATMVMLFCAREKIKQIDHDFYLDLHWHLPNRRGDHHNREKALFDILQKGGLVKNDRFIMNRTQSISIDKERPRVECIINLTTDGAL